MLEHSGGGGVISISSTMGRLAARGFTATAPPKAALAHYAAGGAGPVPTRRVNAIAPGSIEPRRWRW